LYRVYILAAVSYRHNCDTIYLCCDDSQVIRMNIERFSIPELLFHPSDIGIQEMGVAEAVVHTISQTPPGLLNKTSNIGILLLYIYEQAVHRTLQTATS